jgi:ABC-2 type transport system ATP-binding protein
MLGGFEGSVQVAGFDVRTHPLEVRRRIGCLPENARLHESLAVAEHLLLVGRLHGLAGDRVSERGRRLLEADRFAG